MNTAIILTGGKSRRINGIKTPKQLIEINGKPIFIHCLKKYEMISKIDEIFLVINKKFQKEYEVYLKKYKVKKPIKIIEGGATRNNSIQNAIKEIHHNNFVAIQNGCNPNTPISLINNCMREAKISGAATAYMPVYYTVFNKEGNLIKRVFTKYNFGHILDPQIIKVGILKKAFRKRKENKTDISFVDFILKVKCPIRLVKSDNSNFKITTDFDLMVLKTIST